MQKHETFGKPGPNNDQFYVSGTTVFVETEKGILREVFSLGTKAGFHPLAGLIPGVGYGHGGPGKRGYQQEWGWRGNRAPSPLDSGKHVESSYLRLRAGV